MLSHPVYPMTLLLAGIVAAAGRQELSVHGRQEPSVSTQWERLSRASPDLVLAVQIDLSEAGIEEAAGDLLALADPSSSSFEVLVSQRCNLGLFTPGARHQGRSSVGREHS
ncbi:hypothetical protein B0I37DRAFT_383874 [Chaetomium sp. MPI-CAGE-AT-0009]|nr:hypothetical protein B0I37DRAFT_383874 [Chaetomium sp. MPI-CAGE-AT-0009]